MSPLCLCKGCPTELTCIDEGCQRPSSSEQPTPRTDAEVYNGTQERVVSADFSRQLERELNAALDAQKRSVQKTTNTEEK